VGSGFPHEINVASVMLGSVYYATGGWNMNESQKDRTKGFTVVELLIVLASIFILAVIILPSLPGQHTRCRSRINCVNNLKQIGLAFRTWALDNGDKYPMQISVTNGGAMEIISTGTVFTVFQVMSNELSTPKILFCPEETDPKRISATTFQGSVPAGTSAVPFTNDNNVSYFAGLDAQDTNPQMLLSGDRNLAINGVPAPHGLLQIRTNAAVTWFGPRHGNQGNIGLADGSVQQVSSFRLGMFFKQGALATNRLAIP
jgi:prepilin-type processing-associated H-X9-DG protein